MNRLDSIEVFVCVVEQGSLSAAADSLGVSKSHVSRQLARLEQRLDIQLLIRTTRRLRTTEAGQAYFLRAADALHNLSDAERSISDMHDTPRGRLRLTCAGAFGEDILAPLLVRFMQQYPEVQLELEFGNRMVDIVAEGFDIAIRAGSLKDSSLIARRIAGRELLTCASPDYLIKHRQPESLRALAQHNCLVGTASMWHFKEAGRDVELKISGSWRSNNGRALAHAAEMGLGLVQLPSFYVMDALKSGRLQQVLTEFIPRDEAIWAVYPPNRYLSAKVRLLINFLVDHLSV